MLSALKKFWAEESGQGMAEYGLILALIAVVVIGTLAALGSGINQNFTKVKEGLLGQTPQQ
ncbi:MAG: Flp family type IVb pilin [Peptococcaceae bacterium]|nr:Flp family type IVb pilin [Peptococcaceae bacterium]